MNKPPSNTQASFDALLQQIQRARQKALQDGRSRIRLILSPLVRELHPTRNTVKDRHVQEFSGLPKTRSKGGAVL
ncbi:hypothetical protein OR573_03535 [Halomonas sp. CH40]